MEGFGCTHEMINYHGASEAQFYVVVFDTGYIYTLCMN